MQVINRIIDILVACAGLLLLLLMLPWIGLLIKIDSRGPIFYSCDRVGRGGKIFKMYKFRTMYNTPAPVGDSLSPQGDPRVTPVGQVLRRLKLNEFPQFFNVLKGDMSLIGPRPEAVDLAALYPEEARKIFSVKPGLAGPNQILGRNEEELYPTGIDPVKYYLEQILPKKLPLDLQYIEDRAIFKNLKYLYLSVKVTITGAISRQHLVDNRSQIFLMLGDMSICAFSFALAHFLRFDGFSHPGLTQAFWKIWPWMVAVRLPIFIYYGFYHTLIRHLSSYEVRMVFKGVAVSSLLLIGIFFFSGSVLFRQYARGVFLIDWLCLTFLLVSYRVLLKNLQQGFRSGASDPEKQRRVLIWGAGDGGELCLRYLQKDKDTKYDIVGFIDDDPKKRNLRLNGVKVLGNRHHLEVLTKLYKIHEVFVAIPSLAAEEITRALEICNGYGLETKLFHLSTTAHPKTALRRVQVA